MRGRTNGIGGCVVEARGIASKPETVGDGGSCEVDALVEMEPRSRAARDEAGEGGGSVNVVGRTSGSDAFISAATVSASVIGKSSGVVDR